MRTRTDPGSALRQTRLVNGLLRSAMDSAKDVSETESEWSNAMGLLTEADACLSATNTAPPELAKAAERSNALLTEALSILRATNGPEQLTESVARCLALLHPLVPAPVVRDSAMPVRSSRTPSRAAGPGSDRRASPRIVVQTDVSFESESNFYTGFTEDLSDGGLFVATYALKPIGEPIEISFTLPTGHIVNAKGKVRWVRDPRDESSEGAPGMGIQFEGLSSEDQKAIVEFLKARTPLFYDE